MSLGKMNDASLQLCHAKAILELLTEVGSGDRSDEAVEAVMHFVDRAKAIIDGEPEVPADEGS